MQYLIRHEGVRVAQTVVRSRRDLLQAAWQPLAGFDALRRDLEAHWAAEEQGERWDDPAWAAAVTRGIEIGDTLELREGRRHVPTSSIILYPHHKQPAALAAAIIPRQPPLRVGDVIAERVLELETPNGPKPVTIQLGRPRLERDDWHGTDRWLAVGEVVGLPDEPRVAVGSGGVDAMQALLLTMQAVRDELRLAVADGAVLTYLGAADLVFPNMLGGGEASIGELQRRRARRHAHKRREGRGTAE